LRKAIGEEAVPEILTSIRQKTERERGSTGCSAPVALLKRWK
jgi:hypothetical protein